MGVEALRPELEALERVLEQHGEPRLAQLVREAIDGSDQDLWNFLLSNELWGGSGSIADQAGCSQGRHVRRSIEAALVRLGREQIRLGVVNVRTEMWVDSFSKW